MQTNVVGESAGTWSGKLTFYRYRDGIMATGLEGVINAFQKLELNVNLVD